MFIKPFIPIIQMSSVLKINRLQIVLLLQSHPMITMYLRLKNIPTVWCFL